MTSDLHIHPLDHTYYFNMEQEDLHKVTLNDTDKENILNVVKFCCYERKLDTIALTDHDMIQGSLEAAEMVKREGIPINIVTGAECSVFDPYGEEDNKEIHILCLGIQKLPRYNIETPVDELIAAARRLGAYIIMAHPAKYPEGFKRYCALLDGFEFLNSDYAPFENGKAILAKRGISLRPYNGSDFHYRGELPPVSSSVWHSNTYETDPLRG
ncbi:PHP domain-containing protein [Ruminococcaceae bacterium OttesenSCG-928-I18]|nr:PHP domain-containing protein [Ruminococcaceae bacterium OttesenSCG-928-I18]